MNSLSPWDSFLPIQTVLDLHARGIQLYGGTYSDSRDGCLEQSLGNAYQADQYSGSEGKEGGLCFAGFILFYLVSNHCFVDGNKRIGWTCAMRILLGLGLTVNASIDEAEELCMRIADSTRPDSIRDGMCVVDWFAERLIAVD